MSLLDGLRRMERGRFWIECCIWHYIHLRRVGDGMRKKRKDFVGMCQGMTGLCNVPVAHSLLQKYSKNYNILNNLLLAAPKLPVAYRIESRWGFEALSIQRNSIVS